MNPVEFQGVARDAAQITFMRVQERLAELALAERTTPEELIRIYNATKDVAQAVPKEKDNPYLGLPILQITLVNGGVLAQPVVQLVEEGPPEPLEPTPQMLSKLGVNADLEGLE